MGRKRGNPVHGWLVLDKPIGMSSAHAVGAVKRVFEAQKAGHAGTLDPLATGVLPIALGEATKTVPYVMTGEKIYRFTIAWGEARDTGDKEGQVVACSSQRPSRAEIETALPNFVGEYLQEAPAFSALKIGGRRAYKLAREGQLPAMPARKVRIYDIRLLDAPNEDEAELELRCGKGTYIRAFVRDLAHALNTQAYLAALRRRACGPFTEEMAISLDSLRELGHSGAARKQLLAVKTPLDDIPAVAVDSPDAARLRQGQDIILRTTHDLHQGDTVLCLMAKTQQPVALAEYGDGTLRPVRVFNLPDHGDADVGNC
jgi:tRNA pseudouridine55 synthase